MCCSQTLSLSSKCCNHPEGNNYHRPLAVWALWYVTYPAQSPASYRLIGGLLSSQIMWPCRVQNSGYTSFFLLWYWVIVLLVQMFIHFHSGCVCVCGLLWEQVEPSDWSDCHLRIGAEEDSSLLKAQPSSPHYSELSVFMWVCQSLSQHCAGGRCVSKVLG